MRCLMWIWRKKTMMNKLNIKKLITAVEQDDSIKEQCDLHINNHITNVKKGFEWLKSNLPQLFVNCDIVHIIYK